MATWTDPETIEEGEIPSASKLNRNIRDNFLALTEQTVLTSEILTEETRSSTDWGDMATPGPMVNFQAPIGGRVMFAIITQLNVIPVDDNAWISYRITRLSDSAVVVAPGPQRAIRTRLNRRHSQVFTWVEQLVEGEEYEMRMVYRVSESGATIVAERRRLYVFPAMEVSS